MKSHLPIADTDWFCLISAPTGKVRFVCPDCSGTMTIRTAGRFGCQTCGAAFDARPRHSTPTSETFIIRRHHPNRVAR